MKTEEDIVIALDQLENDILDEDDEQHHNNLDSWIEALKWVLRS